MSAIELVEHLTDSDIDIFMHEAYRILQPGGRLLLSTPNYASLWPILEKIVDRHASVTYADQHINHFNKNRLTELFSRYGFKSHVEAYLFSAPFFAGINWSLADFVERCEPSFLVKAFGNLLIGTGIKDG